MTVSASGGIGAAPSLWRNRAAWLKAADIAVVLLAVALPWSTTFAAIFMALWLVLLIPTAERRDITNVLARAACWVPILFVALAAAGVFWATDISWASRFHSLGQVAKLLAIPILILHFEKSGRGLWVGLGFLASCTVLMLLSWLMFVDPRLAFDPVRPVGVPVKNYIAQSQEFALCAFAVLGVALYLIRKRQNVWASILMLLCVGFLANMVFVASSRTVLVCIPILFLLFAVVNFGRRGVFLIIVAVVAAGAVAWMSSPHLRDRASRVATEYQEYQDSNAVTSTGQRLEFWRKSIRFMKEAPLIGHGTGSVKALFERDAVGKTGVSAEIIANPHNQTFGAGVQWGVLGIAVLYAMWFTHLKLFARAAGLVGWVGLVAVAENVVSSVFNSHLFDFAEGWIYVLAVGVAGGMMLHRRPTGLQPATTYAGQV